MEREFEIEVKNDLKVTPIAEQAEIVNPINERAVAETMRILSNFILHEDRVKILESLSSENSSNTASPAAMRKSASNKSIEKFKEEIKQERLAQSRRTDGEESCTARLEKEINAVKSQVSTTKKGVFSDLTFKAIESNIGIIKTSVEAQEKKTDVIIESLKNIDESQSKILKQFTNFEFQMKQLNELLTKNLIVGRVDTPEEKKN